jgi:hypothetical protein
MNLSRNPVLFSWGEQKCARYEQKPPQVSLTGKKSGLNNWENNSPFPGPNRWEVRGHYFLPTEHPSKGIMFGRK